jgi:seryl-tRNA(Sec) selenium transferase
LEVKISVDTFASNHSPAGNRSMVKIPTRLEDLVPPAALGKLLDVLNQPAISGAVRDAMNRVGLKDANPVEQVHDAWQQAKDWVGQLASRFTPSEHGNPQWINATGELIRLDGSGFPMAPSVAKAYADQAIHFHDHSRLEEASQHSAAKLFEGYDVIFTSSLASAILATRQHFERAVVSRADLVRVPGFGDLRSMMIASSTPLVEVGATNGATNLDWENAHSTERDALFLISPNGLDHAASKDQRATAITAARRSHSVVVEILVDGIINNPSPLDLPQIQSRLGDGTDIIIVPLDGFIGGPTGAMIIGSPKTIKRIRGFVGGHGWSLRGPSLAATATALDRAAAGAALDTSILDLLGVNLANLRDRAKRICLQIDGTEKIESSEIIERTSPLGPSPWNRYGLTGVAISIKPKLDTAQLLEKLAAGENGPAVLCERNEDRILIDLRFVPPRDDQELVRALTE